MSGQHFLSVRALLSHLSARQTPSMHLSLAPLLRSLRLHVHGFSSSSSDALALTLCKVGRGGGGIANLSDSGRPTWHLSAGGRPMHVLLLLLLLLPKPKVERRSVCVLKRRRGGGERDTAKVEIVDTGGKPAPHTVKGSSFANSHIFFGGAPD